MLDADSQNKTSLMELPINWEIVNKELRNNPKVSYDKQRKYSYIKECLR